MSEVSPTIASSSSSSSYSLWESMNEWFTPKVLFVLLNVMIGTIFFTSSLANRKQKHQNRQSNGIDRSSSVLQRLKSMNVYAYYYRSQEEPQNQNLSRSSFDSDHAHHFSQDQPLKSQDSYIYDASERNQFVFNEKDAQSREVEAQLQFTFSYRDRISNDFSNLIGGEKSQSPLAFDRTDDFTQTHEEKTLAAAERTIDEVYSQLLAGGGIHFDRSKSDTKPISGDAPARMRKSSSLKSAFGHSEEGGAIITAESRRPATSRANGNSKPTDGDSEVDSKADDFISKFKQQLKLQRLESIIRYKDMIAARGNAKDY